MIFSSYQFILIFLPAVYIVFILAQRIGGWRLAVHVLAAASLVFYAMWGAALFTILLGSLAFNYVMGNQIGARIERGAAARPLLIFGITANLTLLGYLKYTNFFIDVVNQITGAGFGHIHLLASVGVSFYTFIQIGFLIDAYNGQLIRSSFSRYIIFGAFFPCVTAGPLVLHREIMEQLEDREQGLANMHHLIVGLTMFAMGLFKKVVMADSIAPYADMVFSAAHSGEAFGALVAWIGALAYALQLYFDFSGYSDMALGTAFMFGLRLPLNFDSPFKAANISDFWRRWHMTMTRFFTTYIYSGLAMSGMRKSMQNGSGRIGRFMRTAALPSIITFLVAGVWHGAGWNMVIYGLIHGIAIACFLGWREFSGIKLPHAAGWAITMAVVVSALVVFRAPDLATAGHILAGMWNPLGWFAGGGLLAGLDAGRALSMIVLFGAAVLLLPNTQQILHRAWISSDTKPENAALEAGLLTWRPALAGAAVVAAAYTISFTSMGNGMTFLYYQF